MSGELKGLLRPVEIGDSPIERALEGRVLKLFRERMVAWKCLPKELGAFSRSRLSLAIERDVENLCARLETEMLCQSLEERQVTVAFEYPASWWQHLKGDLFPAWLLRRFPVRQKRAIRVVKYEVLAGYPRANWVPAEMGDPVILTRKR